METGALNRPPAALEGLVCVLTPPGAREAVLGDLCESYVRQRNMRPMRCVFFLS